MIKIRISELEQRVNILSLVAPERLEKAGKTFRLNPCPVCGKQDHFTIYPGTNSYSSFNECCTGGGPYKYLQEVEKLNEAEAYKKLNELAGISSLDETAATVAAKKISATPEPPEEAPSKDYTALVTKLYHECKDFSYFTNRGVPQTLIEKYKLCTADINGRRAVLPIWEGGQVVYYTARAIEGQEPKYKNTTGEAKIFNAELLKEEGPVFICEGIFDALSLEAAGYRAVALGGVNQISKIEEALKIRGRKGNITLIAFDNDEAGQAAATKLPFTRLVIPEEYKDINEWFVSDSRGLIQSLEQQIKVAIRPDAISLYIGQQLLEDINLHKQYAERKTGFSNLDLELQGLYAGLYVVGGISSVGKTTFCHQLADQLAEQGEHVLFFSLEQSKLELVTKSLARLTAKKDFDSAVTNLRIRAGETPPQVTQAAERYADTATRLSIIEGNYSTTAGTIRSYAEGYMRRNKVNPVVIIDYLQILQADNPQANDKQRLDEAATALKRMSRDLGITVIAISSLNRSNYLTPIDYESFKESGGIEYTADVILGLQLNAINEALFNETNKIKAKRERIQEAKSATPRDIELVCLKNRNGKPYFNCYFAYYPKHDLYVEQKPSPFDKDTRL